MPYDRVQGKMVAVEHRLKKTPLFKHHQQRGAKLVAFGGWEMPLHYEGALSEHRAVREAAGLFDVSHMGEIFIRGEGSLEALQNLIPNNAARLKDGEILYTPLCTASGGVIDDVLLHRIDAGEWFFCTNATNIEKDLEWIRSHIGAGAEAADESADWVQLALQGPHAASILQPLTDFDLDQLYYYQFTQQNVAGIPARIARTGYTGEDGFEIYVSEGKGTALWETLLEVGEKEGLKPGGLAARDILRLEMGYPLYGHELTEEVTPLEAGLGWTIAWEKESFIGKESLEKRRAEGIRKKLIGIETTKGIPREGYPILVGEEKVGEVTSGTHSPTLKKGIALGYVDTDVWKEASECGIGIRNRTVAAKKATLPFCPSHVRRKRF